MGLPYLKEDGGQQTRSVNEFGGYRRELTVSEQEFYDMKNLSSRAFPAVTTRKPRGTFQAAAIQKPNGFLGKDKLCWVDGTKVFYDGEQIASVTDSKKQLLSMGAYLLIFPDKLRYNTITKELDRLEAQYTSSGISFTEHSIVTTGANFTGFRVHDGVTISGSSEDGNNKTAIIMEVKDKELVFSEHCFTASSAGRTVTVARTVPDLERMIELDNRIWGVKGHEILASKLGDPCNWACFEGLSTDSYAATVGSDGAFTGIAAMLGSIIFFKENGIHKLYGSKPSNYQIMGSKLRGVQKGSESSLAQVDEVLFYLSDSGVLAYMGGTPEFLSGAFGGESYKNGVGGGCRGKYYLSAQNSKTDDWVLFVYDIKKQLWHKEDDTHALYVAECGGMLYYIDAVDCRIKAVEGNDPEQIYFELQFGGQGEGFLGYKTLTRLQLHLSLSQGGFCDILIRYDGFPTWERLYTLPHSPSRKILSVPVMPRRYGQFELKLSGQGEMTLFSISRVIEGGSELG